MKPKPTLLILSAMLIVSAANAQDTSTRPAAAPTPEASPLPPASVAPGTPSSAPSAQASAPSSELSSPDAPLVAQAGTPVAPPQSGGAQLNVVPVPAAGDAVPVPVPAAPSQPPSIVIPAPAGPPAREATVINPRSPAQRTPSIVQRPAAVAATPVTPAAPDADAETASPKNEIRMNFQNASLPDVLNYLSSAAGFVIVQETPVTGTVNIISKQPVDADGAVAVLNSVLMGKGYVAIRDGRILKIVSKTNVAQRSELPVVIASATKPIPKTDTMATYIIPVRYVDATKLIENLRPLLAADASLTVNEGSNALLLTDTEANIHRMAEIVKALDTSVSSISTIKVYPLRFADAKDFSNVLMQLFNTDQTSGSNNGRGGGGGGAGAFFARFGGGGGGGGRGGGGGGGEEGGAEGDSEARKAATRVVAVPDTQSNSVVVSAPDEYIATIDEIVARLDTSTTDVTETRIFQLQNADANAVSGILTQLYGDPTTTSNGNRNGQNRNGQGNNGRGGGGNPFAGGGQQQGQATQLSQRELQQARMVAVADPRTNSILVNCSPDTMIEVATTIGKLDTTDARKQHVHTIALEHANPDTVVSILRILFGDTTSPAQTQSALSTYQTNGVDSSITGVLGTSTGGGSNRGGGGF